MSARPIVSAEILSIGTELTVGETLDTNAGELARDLAAMGIAVGRIQALPDLLESVLGAFRAAVERVDLVVSTGGLGPTPDDLTREAVAAAMGETPIVDPELERWLRELWARRNLPFPEINLKQAWLIPSATAIPNPNGTAPGWWVDREDGGLIVAMPGPPREMRAMWTGDVLSRLRGRGAGQEVASRTLRLAGIGESQVADLLGEPLLRATDPVVATYARADAVDVRISARGVAADGSSPAARVAATATHVANLLAGHVWAEGATSWGEAIGAALGGARAAIVEIGSGGSLATLLGGSDWITFTESLGSETSTARDHATRSGLEHLARRAAELGETRYAIAIRTRERGPDMSVSVVVVTPGGVHRERRVVFLGGSMGRTRAALAAAQILLSAIRDDPPEPSRDTAGSAPAAGFSDEPRAAARPGRGRRSDPARGGGGRRP